MKLLLIIYYQFVRNLEIPKEFYVELNYTRRSLKVSSVATALIV